MGLSGKLLGHVGLCTSTCTKSNPLAIILVDPAIILVAEAMIQCRGHMTDVETIGSASSTLNKDKNPVLFEQIFLAYARYIFQP